jgi:hypothetical protein
LDEYARDARFGMEELRKFISAVDVLKQPYTQSLPRIQLKEAKRQAWSYARFAGRIIDDLVDKDE